MTRHVRRVYWLATSALLVAACASGVLNAPDDPALGTAQRVLYLHLPFAVNAYIACLVVFVASAVYLATRRERWDAIAHAAARVAMIACTIVLLTGMILAKSAWGEWWVWSPKLTFSLVLWGLFVAYLLIRPMLASPDRRALVSAVYAIIAFLDVPLVYLWVRLLPDVHPTSMTLDPGATWTVLVACVAATLLCLGLMVMPRCRGSRAATVPRGVPAEAKPAVPGRAAGIRA